MIPFDKKNNPEKSFENFRSVNEKEKTSSF